nr:hypothetical protein [Halomicroarcula sp. SYNS111]
MADDVAIRRRREAGQVVVAGDTPEVDAGALEAGDEPAEQPPVRLGGCLLDDVAQHDEQRRVVRCDVPERRLERVEQSRFPARFQVDVAEDRDGAAHGSNSSTAMP